MDGDLPPLPSRPGVPLHPQLRGLAGYPETIMNLGGAFLLRRLSRGLAAVALVGGIFAATGGIAVAQTTPQTWEVLVGGGGSGPADAPPVYDAQAYGPGPVIIRAGDTVTWRFRGFHTVTFNSGKPDLPLIMP